MQKMHAFLLRIQILASQGFLVGDAQASQVDAAGARLELDKRMGSLKQ
jgi:hypothetical protein